MSARQVNYLSRKHSRVVSQKHSRCLYSAADGLSLTLSVLHEGTPAHHQTYMLLRALVAATPGVVLVDEYADIAADDHALALAVRCNSPRTD